jgi:hypothetical protein
VGVRPTGVSVWVYLADGRRMRPRFDRPLWVIRADGPAEVDTGPRRFASGHARVVRPRPPARRVQRGDAG